MKVLITGACGLIGRALITELEEKHELRLIGRTRPEEATVFQPGAPDNRVRRPFASHWPFVQAEVTDPNAIEAAADGMDAIIHLAAAVTGLPESGVETFRTNALGTFIVLDAARRTGLQRVLCASSINAFGTFYGRLSGRPAEYTKMPLDETFDPVPEDPYSLSKLVNEETCAAFHRAHGLTTAAFRIASVWTEEVYAKAICEGLATTEAWSDDLFQWVHINDVVRGLRLALEAPDLPGYGVYTLGAADTRCPEPTMEILQRFRPDLAQRLETALDGRVSLLSIEHARRVFGYTPHRRLGI